MTSWPGSTPNGSAATRRQELLPLIEEEWAKAGFSSDRTREEILAAIALLQPRARSLKDFAGAFRGYFSDAL